MKGMSPQFLTPRAAAAKRFRTVLKNASLRVIYYKRVYSLPYSIMEKRLTDCPPFARRGKGIIPFQLLRMLQSENFCIRTKSRITLITLSFINIFTFTETAEIFYRLRISSRYINCEVALISKYIILNILFLYINYLRSKFFKLP